jgi:hypothetical protein
MSSLFDIITFAQNGGCQLHCIFCTAWLCYAKLFERFLAFPEWFQLLLQRSRCVSTAVLYTRLCMYPQRKKSNGVKSGKSGGQLIEPPCPIHLLPKVSSKYSRMTLVKCAWVPSCWNYISQQTSKGTTSSSLGKVSWRNIR